MREDALAEAVASYLNLALPPGSAFTHVPNEGKRGWKAQRDLKTHGVMAGFPDLVILSAGHACLIELKAPHRRAKTSDAQIAAHIRLKAAGFPVHICRTLAEVEMALTVAGITTRARVAA